MGLGSSTAIYSAVRHTLLHPLPYPDSDRLVNIWRSVGDGGFFLGPDAEQLDLYREQSDIFEDVIAYTSREMTLTGRGDPTPLYALQVSPGYLDFLGLEPVLGRSFLPEEGELDTRVVVLGNGVWTRRFGSDPDVLGTSVSLDGEPWTVVGVAPRDAPLPNGFAVEIGFWVPLTPSADITNGIARLRPGVTVAAAQERARVLDARAAEAGEASRYEGSVNGITEFLGNRLRDTLRTLGVAVGLLLLIGCLNVSTLFINRADARRHDTAVRVALGVGRGRLLRQHMMESTLLAGTAGAVGLVLAQGLIKGALFVRPEALAALDRVTLDPNTVVFALGLSVATGLIFGGLPALHATRQGSEAALRAGGTRSGDTRGAQRARWALVVGEVTLSFALLVGSGLLLRTVVNLQRVDPGFQPEGLAVVSVDLPTWQYATGAAAAPVWLDILTTVRRLPSVRDAALSHGLPTQSGIFFGQLEIEGQEVATESAQEPFYGVAVDDHYVTVIGQRILRGRGFTPEEVRDEAPVYVVGETAAAGMWPGENPVGRHFRLGGSEWSTVVGVVEDATTNQLGEPARKQLYTPLGKAGRSARILLRVDGDVSATLAQVRQIIRQREPDAPVELGQVANLLQATISTQRFTMSLLAALAFLAALLACIGLYAVVAHGVGRRTREIGIRISLGARTDEIVWMVARSGAAAILLGVMGGTALSMAGTKVIGSLLHGVEAGDPLTLAGAAALLAGAALVATLVPACRAARVDPVRAIARE
jgi:predicted permease